MRKRGRNQSHKNQKKPNPAISFRLLAEGYCKSIENSRRLIDDGEVLLKIGRYLGAINSFRLAIEEISKAHLLNQPVGYGRSDSKKWEWLWKAFHSHWEKQSIILWELHRDKFRDEHEFDDMVKLMLTTRSDSIYVKYDQRKKKFLSPEESLGLGGELQEIAKQEFQYVLAVFKMFTIAGMPTVDEIEKVFIMQHDEETKNRH